MIQSGGITPMKSSFEPEYSYHLGIADGRWLGHKNPARDFNRANIAMDARTDAYFEGLRVGVQVTARCGLVSKCSVHWDNPGFDTPACLGHATHVGIADYGHPHVLSLCDKHTAMAHECNRKVGTPQGFPKPWAIIPISWL